MLRERRAEQMGETVQKPFASLSFFILSVLAVCDATLAEARAYSVVLPVNGTSKLKVRLRTGTSRSLTGVRAPPFLPLPVDFHVELCTPGNLVATVLFDSKHLCALCLWRAGTHLKRCVRL